MKVPDFKSIRSRALPQKAITLFACRKCRKKCKQSGSAPLRLKKILKQCARQEDFSRVRLIDLPCVKLCPRAAITACTAGQLARSECSILRTGSDAQALFQLACREVDPVSRFANPLC